MQHTLVALPTEIDRVLQQLRQRAARERDTADETTILIGSRFGADAQSIKLSYQRGERPECRVTIEDQPNRLCFALADDQLAVGKVIADGNRSPCIPGLLLPPERTALSGSSDRASNDVIRGKTDTDYTSAEVRP